MLTDIPIGAWSCALVFDLFRSDRADALIGLGILSALPTAASGLSDLADVEDRRSRSVGAAHAIGNTSALTLYALSFVARKVGRPGAGRRLSVLGAAAMAASRFLGGHLSYRRGIGVDHTVFDGAPPDWTPVLDDADLVDGVARKVALGRTDVLIYRDGSGTIRAIANRCTHRGGPLYKGRIQDGTVRCPWHLSVFGLEDGRVLRGPATAPQTAFDVRVQDGRIELLRRS